MIRHRSYIVGHMQRTIFSLIIIIIPVHHNINIVCNTSPLESKHDFAGLYRVSKVKPHLTLYSVKRGDTDFGFTGLYSSRNRIIQIILFYILVLV